MRSCVHPGPWTILLLVVVGAFGVLAFGWLAARALIYNLQIQRLKIEAHALHAEYMRKLDALRNSEAWENAELAGAPAPEPQAINVDIVDEDEALEAQRAAA
jgi:hypothetical protein